MLKVTMTVFDHLSRQLDEAQRAFAELDGELGVVKFDPNDPASIEGAIHQMETTIDQRAGEYASNPMIGPLIEGLKETYRKGILERAAEARLRNDSEQ